MKGSFRDDARLSIRSFPSRRAHAAHRDGRGDLRLPRRPDRRRGDAEPRRASVDRPAVERPAGHRPQGLAGRRRAHRAPGRPPCRPRGPRRRARASPPNCRRRASASRVCCRPWPPRPASPSAAPPSPSSPSTTTSTAGIMIGRQAERLRARGPRPQEHPRRRRHLDRQDHPGQRPAGRGRQDRRPRGADRGHPRAAMRRAQPGGAAHQGRRGLALRPRPLGAAPAARPHPHRRGARRRGARSPQGLGHRPSRRRRHPARRLGASAPCAGSSS